MATAAPFTASLSLPLERAATWGHLTFNYLAELMAEGVYGEMLSYLGEPSVHARIAEFLEQERRHAVGLRAHILEVGPPLPAPLVDCFRHLSAWLGLGFALRGTGAFQAHASQLEQWSVQRYGELAERFPPHSPEAERYRRYQQEEIDHREWLSAYPADRGRDEVQAQFEVIEFASTWGARPSSCASTPTSSRWKLPPLRRPQIRSRALRVLGAPPPLQRARARGNPAERSPPGAPPRAAAPAGEPATQPLEARAAPDFVVAPRPHPAGLPARLAAPADAGRDGPGASARDRAKPLNMRRSGVPGR